MPWQNEKDIPRRRAFNWKTFVIFYYGDVEQVFIKSYLQNSPNCRVHEKTSCNRKFENSTQSREIPESRSLLSIIKLASAIFCLASCVFLEYADRAFTNEYL